PRGLLGPSSRHAGARSGKCARQVRPAARAQERHAGKQDGARERKGKDDPQDSCVDYTDFAEAWHLGRVEPEVDPDGRGGGGEPDDASNSREKETLTEEATREVTVGRTYRGRDRDLMTWGLCAQQPEADLA